MPGTFVETLITSDMTTEDMAAMRLKYDLDRSMFYRYGKYMYKLVQGDLGMSLKFNVPVFDTYIQRLPNTLSLSFAAALIGIVISIPIGIRAARKAGTITDTVVTGFSLIGMSMPAFWLGLLLMLLFALRLNWLPVGSNKDGIRSLILPAICSAMSLTALCARQTRSSMLDVLNSDFLRTARSKGVPEKVVIRKHALGNALIPIVTTIGGQICMMLAGSAVVEQVFAWPGVGRMLVEGVNTRDTPVILGCTILTTILYVVVMLVVDLLYAFIDPRIKSQFIVKKNKNAGLAPVLPDPGALNNRPVTPDALSAVSIEEPAVIETGLLTAAAEPAAAESAALPTEYITAATVTEYDETKSADVSRFVTRQDENTVNISEIGDVAEIIRKYRKRSQMGELWHKLVHNKSSLAGIVILSFILLVALGSLFISYEAITSSNIPARFSPPGWQFPFGTDALGRNAFLRVIYGTRYSVIVGFGSVLFSVVFGVSLGAIAAYYGGKADNIIMRISDGLASIPGLMLGMVIMLVLGMKLHNLIIAVGIAGVTHFIRMSRASILTVKNNEFVEAARAVGFSDLRIILTQVLPNGLSPIMVQISISLGFAIMISSALSYLGFGIPPPLPEWGTLVNAGRESAITAPWLMTFPGIAIMIIVLGFNLLGDGLRDALDPKLKK